MNSKTFKDKITIMMWGVNMAKKEQKVEVPDEDEIDEEVLDKMQSLECPKCKTQLEVVIEEPDREINSDEDFVSEAIDLGTRAMVGGLTDVTSVIVIYKADDGIRAIPIMPKQFVRETIETMMDLLRHIQRHGLPTGHESMMMREMPRYSQSEMDKAKFHADVIFKGYISKLNEELGIEEVVRQSVEREPSRTDYLELAVKQTMVNVRYFDELKLDGQINAVRENIMSVHEKYKCECGQCNKPPTDFNHDEIKDMIRTVQRKRQKVKSEESNTRHYDESLSYFG